MVNTRDTTPYLGIVAKRIRVPNNTEDIPEFIAGRLRDETVELYDDELCANEGGSSMALTIDRLVERVSTLEEKLSSLRMHSSERIAQLESDVEGLNSTVQDLKRSKSFLHQEIICLTDHTKRLEDEVENLRNENTRNMKRFDQQVQDLRKENIESVKRFDQQVQDLRKENIESVKRYDQQAQDDRRFLQEKIEFINARAEISEKHLLDKLDLMDSTQKRLEEKLKLLEKSETEMTVEQQQLQQQAERYEFSRFAELDAEGWDLKPSYMRNLRNEFTHGGEIHADIRAMRNSQYRENPRVWLSACIGFRTVYGSHFEDLAREIEHAPMEIGKTLDMTRNLNHIYFWKNHPCQDELLSLCSSVIAAWKEGSTPSYTDLFEELVSKYEDAMGKK